MVGNTISHQKQNNNLPKEHKIGEGRKHNNENTNIPNESITNMQTTHNIRR